ncbi:MAG: 16S rRNA (cytidine(1402)-2'-O)-methyltransferase [Bacteroidota bacterium]
MSGKLYLVPTPIGNLEDITLRAIRILSEVDMILAEDTRKTSVLLKKYDISKKLQSHHKFNEHKSIESIIELLKQGTNIALVSDAGTPSVSDPGFILVRDCIKNQIATECLPGPTAFIPALVNSGFSSDRFCFEGFLPQKKGRQKKLKALVDESRTMIFYESTHRLIKALHEFAECFGSDRLISVSRELTKIHEENIRGTIVEIINYYEAPNRSIKGEIVIVVEGKK